jgi:tetratricopeptide (TPR) repeat protein
MSVLGILQMHAGDLEKAFKNIKSAQTLSPADPRINAALGDVYRRQGNEMFAAKYYEDALRYERDHAEAQLGVTLMAIDTGKFEAADRFVKRLLALDPPPSPRQMAVARMAYAIVLDEQGKGVEADKEQTMALETDSRNPELFMLKARRQLRASKQDEALASIREAIKRDPKRASFRAELAKVLITKPGGSAEAVKEIQEAIKQMGESPKLLVILGDAQRADKDLNGAQASFEKALSLAKDKYPEARLALADVAREKKDWAKALDLYEKAKNEFLSSARKQAYALVEMGKILDVQQQNKKDALERYKAAANADSTYAPPLFLMSQFFIGDKDKTKRDTAYGLLEKCVELDPKGEYAEEAKRLLADKK